MSYVQQVYTVEQSDLDMQQPIFFLIWVIQQWMQDFLTNHSNFFSAVYSLHDLSFLSAIFPEIKFILNLLLVGVDLSERENKSLIT